MSFELYSMVIVLACLLVCVGFCFLGDSFWINGFQFQFFISVWATKNIALSVRANKKSGFPLFFIIFGVCMCGREGDLRVVGARREVRLKGFHHISGVTLCVFHLELVDLLVRPIQNNVLDGREACGESGKSRLAEHNELLVLRVVFLGVQFQILDFRQAEMAAVNLLDNPFKVPPRHLD